MAKRVGFLMQDIADPDNLRLAFWKARKGKEGKADVVAFSDNLDGNLLALREALMSGTVAVGNYHYFTIHDPKERLICAASFRERVLHHAIMNVCHPYFERFLISDSYATRVGKGQYAALERAKHYSSKYHWFCKLDVRKYFDSIDHGVLYHKLTSRFKDPALLALFWQIINSYETSPGKGLPIGNLTSQYFANFYLGFADHFIKEKLRVEAYVRYMDDMVMWGNDKELLLSHTRSFTVYMNTVFQLTLKPPCINMIEKGLPFLGYVLFKDCVRLNKNSKRRFVQKMRLYRQKIESGVWSQAQYAGHVLPLVSFAQHADTFDLRTRMMNNKEAGRRARTA